MTRHRAILEGRYNAVYTRVEGDQCAYCGIHMEAYDHIPPISMLPYFTEKAFVEMRFVLIPACGECNSALNNQPILSVTERRAFVRNWLKQRYQKALRMPKWDEDELDELNSTFADEIRKASIQSEWVKQRITFRGIPELEEIVCVTRSEDIADDS